MHRDEIYVPVVHKYNIDIYINSPPFQKRPPKKSEMKMRKFGKEKELDRNVMR